MEEDDIDGGLLGRTTPTRVQNIFSVMSNTNRIDVLRILNSRGSLAYSELKGMAGFRSKKESGKFAYHLRKMTRQSLVVSNKNDKRYTITNLGRMVLDLAGQIEKKSVMESSRMYVRTSHQSIEEFNSERIAQSLVREGRLPMEQAQKITEEVENRIYKYQTSYLTGPLIRELVNTVLLEEGHEEYRNKMTRLGIPAYDMREMLTNADAVRTGAERLVFDAGMKIFSEYLLTNTLPTDAVDMYLSGSIHVSNLATWSLMPDTIFVQAEDLFGWSKNGTSIEQAGIVASVSNLLNRISWEASNEVVISGLIKALNDASATESDITGILNTIRTPPTGCHITIRLDPSDESTNTFLKVYNQYINAHSVPTVGLALARTGIDGHIKDIIDMIRRGATISIGDSARWGIHNSGGMRTALKMHSMSINLPHLAFECNQDEKYFRARLAMLMDPIMAALESRRKDVSDITRRGLNPFLAKHTVYEDRRSVEMMINFVGLNEAVGDVILMGEDRKHETIMKVLNTASQIVAERSRKSGATVSIGMAPSKGSARLVELDAKREGKDHMLALTENGIYSQGVTVDVRQVGTIMKDDAWVLQVQDMDGKLGGGLYTCLVHHVDTPEVDMIEAISYLSDICDFTIQHD